MRRRFIITLAILLFASLGLSCSRLPRRDSLTWRLVLQSDAAGADRDAVIGRTVKVIERRLDDLGIRNSRVVAEGTPLNGQIVVSLPNISDRERLKTIITAGGLLEMAAVVSPTSPSPVQTYKSKEEALISLGDKATDDRRVLPYVEREDRTPGLRSGEKSWVVIEVPAIVDGGDLRSASAIQSAGSTDDYQILFSLGPEGANKLGAWTGSHINNYLGVVLNGEVRTIVYIKSRISDQGEISGRFTKQSAEDLALVLRSGTLPAPVKVVEETAIR
jgi:preprotein translocase subunit SecD